MRNDRVALGLGWFDRPYSSSRRWACTGTLPAKSFSPPGVVVVQVAHGDGVDVVEVDADLGERLLDRLAGAAAAPGWYSTVGVEAPVQRGVADQRGVETGVEQHPAAVGLQQDAGHRFTQPLLGRAP